MAETKSLVALKSYEVDEKVASGELLLSDRGGRSKVWKIFARITNQEGVEIHQFVFCRFCEKTFKRAKINTSNLVRHKCYLERNVTSHKKSGDEDEEELEDTVEEKTNLTISEYTDNNLTKLITKWIVKECRPFDLIQSDGLKSIFQEFARLGWKLGPVFEVATFLPAKSEVTKNVNEIYEQCVQNVNTEIASIKENGFGLTTGTWIDHFTQEIYIALTVHYLKNGVLTFRLLGLKSLEGDIVNRSENVAKNVKQILSEFNSNLSSKTILVTNEDINTAQYFKNTQNLPCISELLSNALEKSVQEVPKITHIITACSKLLNFLMKAGLHSLFEGPLQISYDNSWQNAYKILNAVETNWSEIEGDLLRRNETAQISTINFSHLKAVSNIFQTFDEAIETFEDDSYPTLHLVLVYLHELKKTCDTNDSEFKDFDFIEQLKKNIQVNLEKIVTSHVTILHKLALFLYPPTNKLLQFSDNEKKHTEDECLRLMKHFETELTTKVKQEPELPPSPATKRRKLFTDFIQPASKRDPNECMIQEIKLYKNTNVENNADFEVFNWWRMQKEHFPLLYKVSCTVLATPASNAASRRIFSTAQSLLHERSKQGPNDMNIEKIMFINTNDDCGQLDSHFSSYEGLF